MTRRREPQTEIGEPGSQPSPRFETELELTKLDAAELMEQVQACQRQLRERADADSEAAEMDLKKTTEDVAELTGHVCRCASGDLRRAPRHWRTLNAMCWRRRQDQES